MVTPSLNFRSGYQGTSGKPGFLVLKMITLDHDRRSPCFTSCIKVPTGQGLSLFNRLLLSTPTNNSITLQPHNFPGAYRGSPISANKAAPVGLEWGSVVKFLPNIQRPGWTAKPNTTLHKTPSSSPLLRIHVHVESIFFLTYQAKPSKQT